MDVLLLAVAVLIVSGIISLFVGQTGRILGTIGAGGAVVGCLIGLIPVLQILFDGYESSIVLPWSIPFGSFSAGLDALSAFFLLPIFILVGLASIYGGKYLRNHGAGKKHISAWFFFNLLAASMVMVVVARNGMLFLMSWEVMAMSSFFLVTFYDHKEDVRAAGWIYFVATHTGTAFLFAFFALMGKLFGSLDFAAWASNSSAVSTYSWILFLLALVGFGTKAGLIPFHVWLPKAHPVAPSHVSAVMSGVMIKTGIYGFVRMLMFLGPIQEWWGPLLVVIGSVSGILGVLYALAQHDIKSLLAYHSVENIGIITLGLGIGLIGLFNGHLDVAVLGFGGGILHVLNHALFKGLLFLGAGSVISATGTSSIDAQGGLLKRMPKTGISFLVGSAAISGLPPLNGFVSEFLIYMAAFISLVKYGTIGAPSLWYACPAILTIASLALIGGLAQSCFAKAFGIVFLGEPRSSAAEKAVESSRMMWVPMIILAFACIAIGLAAPAVLYLPARAVTAATGLSLFQVDTALNVVRTPFVWIVLISASFIVLVTVFWITRNRMLRGRNVRCVSTWDCGYDLPASSMQYTASSFAMPTLLFFRSLIGFRSSKTISKDLFPESASFESHAGDLFLEKLFAPLFRCVEKVAMWLRLLQYGSVHLYILYITIALLLLLVWKIGGMR